MLQRKDAALIICFFRVLLYWYSNIKKKDWISWNLKSVERQSVGIISWIRNIRRESICSATVIEKSKVAGEMCHAWLCAALVPVGSKSWTLLLKATVESGNIDCELLSGRVFIYFSRNRSILASVGWGDSVHPHYCNRAPLPSFLSSFNFERVNI